MCRASFAVRGVGLFCDDALESHRGHLLEECFAFAFDVIECAQWPELGNDVDEKLFALGEGKRPKIEILECEEIEHIECRRQLDRRSLDFERRAQPATTLKQREARQTFPVGHDYFAVNDAL